MTRPARQRARRSGRSAREHVGPEHWQRIPVPALITEEQYALAQELLARNCRLSPRNTRQVSLLQGILVCRECGYAYYRSSTRSRNGVVRHYYRCSGSDSYRRPEGRVCANRPVRMQEIDELVWTQVLALLDKPALIEAEIDRRLATLRAAHPASHRREGLKRDLARAQNALRRLIDGYQEQLITLEELRGRTPELRKREATLRAELDALDAKLHDAETYLKLTETLEGFHARLAANAGKLTIEQRQQIVRLVVREVLIGDDDITVRHSIPVPTDDHPTSSRLRVLATRGELVPKLGDRDRTSAEKAAGRRGRAGEAGARQGGERPKRRPGDSHPGAEPGEPLQAPRATLGLGERDRRDQLLDAHGEGSPRRAAISVGWLDAARGERDGRRGG